MHNIANISFAEVFTLISPSAAPTMMTEQLNVEQISLASTKSSASQSQLLATMPPLPPPATEQVKLACFQPGLEGFQNMWYLTVIDDASGVHEYPRFLPGTVRTCSV